MVRRRARRGYVDAISLIAADRITYESTTLTLN